MKISKTAGLRSGWSSMKLQRGITLLESLVSIVILAVAVLGMLGVQLRTLNETQTGVRRAQAVRLIEDFAERIKSNPRDYAAMDDYVSDWTSSPAGINCRTANCTSAQLAKWDVQEWKASVANFLPNAKANIFLSTAEAADPGNRRQLGVMVGWRVNERTLPLDTGNQYKQYFLMPSNAPVTCPTDLTCHLVYVQP